MKFTVVIPTRERSDTLYYALKTCVTQDYDNFEILVSDNFSQDNTREVVDSFEDKRIRYVNTGKRVSMSSNWEFALSHIEDGYVFYLGDDDGLMPNSVHDVSKIIDRFKCQAVVWPKVAYCWPCETHNANRMIIPLRKELVITDSRAILSAIMRWRVPFTRGPSLYTSFVDTKVIWAVKGSKELFFNSVTPDVYSSFALLSGMDTFLYCERPLTVSGGSRHSNWVKCTNFISEGGSLEDYGDRFAEEMDFPIHRSIDLFPGSMTATVAEALMQANDTCYKRKIRVNLRKIIWQIFNEYSHKDTDTYQNGMKRLDRLTSRLGMKTYYKLCKSIHRNKYVPNDLHRVDKTHLGYIHLKSLETLGVQDVFGAASLAHKILGDFVMPERARNFRSYHPYTGFLHRRLAPYMDVR